MKRVIYVTMFCVLWLGKTSVFAADISNTELSLNKGQIKTIQIIDTEDEVLWESSDEEIVTVSEQGELFALEAGEAIVSAEVGDEVFECTIEVSENGINHTSFVMEGGERLRLHFFKGSKKINWKSSDRKVAKILNGRIHARNKGKTVIRAEVGKRTYQCLIQVKKAKKHVIYLTFDDGPSLTSTPVILDILKRQKVPATFFVINYDKEGEQLIQRAVDEGHEIAIHGYSHDYNTIYKTQKAYMNNVVSLQDKLYKTLGYRVWTTRFPGGSSNLISKQVSSGIMTKLVNRVDKEGFTYFDWNVSSGDAGGATTAEEVYRNVTKALKKNRENVVLMHDFSNNEKTMDALERIVKYGKKNGYTFKSITDSTTEVHHNIQN